MINSQKPKFSDGKGKASGWTVTKIVLEFTIREKIELVRIN
jgi:hypothetical protein